MKVHSMTHNYGTYGLRKALIMNAYFNYYLFIQIVNYQIILVNHCKFYFNIFRNGIIIVRRKYCMTKYSTLLK